MTVETDRLILRPWAERDRQPFAKMSNDPAVMKYVMPLEGSAAIDQWVDRQKAHLAEHGFCFWAMENKATGAFTGAVGLLRVAYTAHFTTAVEVGWRIPQPFLGARFRFRGRSGIDPIWLRNAHASRDRRQYRSR